MRGKNISAQQKRSCCCVRASANTLTPQQNYFCCCVCVFGGRDRRGYWKSVLQKVVHTQRHQSPLSPRPFPRGGKGGREPPATATGGDEKKEKIRKIKSKEKKKSHKHRKKFMEHAILFSATRALEYANATKHLYFVAFAQARIKRDRRNKIIVLLAFA